MSVIVPCRNEKGNIQAAVERIPDMGKHTEIIFCDDKSTDGTADEVRRMQELYPDRDIRLLDGPGICKAENVWTGFRGAKGDILMILDADLTVMPEELPIFFKALVENTGEFVNGSRLVYPVPKTAMKFFNQAGNRVFGIVFSYLLNQRFKDTLCGTKVLMEERLAEDRERAGKLGHSRPVGRLRADFRRFKAASGNCRNAGPLSRARLWRDQDDAGVLEWSADAAHLP